MLSHHYTSGMTADTLCFHEVRADDPLVTGSGYVDLRAALPGPEGDDFWLKALPPFGESLALRATFPLLTVRFPSVSLRVPAQPEDSRKEEEGSKSRKAW